MSNYKTVFFTLGILQVILGLAMIIPIIIQLIYLGGGYESRCAVEPLVIQLGFHKRSHVCWIGIQAIGGLRNARDPAAAAAV